MKQISLAEGFEKYRKPTRREKFLQEMDQIIPWKDLCQVIEPFYPQGRGAGRPPIGVERMLRIHFMQHWFNLSDPAMEEALYESRSMRKFADIDLGREPAPDETTMCKFRHLLERHNLGEEFFRLVNEYLAENGLQVAKGTIVDATIIDAPSSTKNKDKARDPEMHQTRKGNEWRFGMKCHIGVDSRSKLIHSVTCTSANVHDSRVIQTLLHGQETRVWGDSAYTGQRDQIRSKAPYALDFTQKKGSRYRKLSAEERARNRQKSRVRAKVEHPFLVIKRLFGFSKVRYRGMMKNGHRAMTACALANLYMVRRRLA